MRPLICRWRASERDCVRPTSLETIRKRPRSECGKRRGTRTEACCPVRHRQPVVERQGIEVAGLRDLARGVDGWRGSDVDVEGTLAGRDEVAREPDEGQAHDARDIGDVVEASEIDAEAVAARQQCVVGEWQ